MAALTNQVAELQERIQDSLADMKPRDRSLLLGLVLFMMVGTVVGGIWWMRGSIAAKEKQVAAAQTTLSRLREFSATQADNQSKIVELGERLDQYADTDVSSFLEQAAQKVQIREKLDSVRKKTETADGVLLETVYTVKLSRLSQDELSKLLWQVEGTGFPLKVRTFKVRARSRKGETFLDVDMDVSSFKIVTDDGDGDE